MVQRSKVPDRASSRLGMQLRRKAQEDFEQQQKREIKAFLQEPVDAPVDGRTKAVDVPKTRPKEAKVSNEEGRYDQMLRDGIVPEGAMQQKLTRYNLTLLNAQSEGPRCGVQDLEYDKLPQHLKDYVDKFGTTLHGPPQAAKLLDELFHYWDTVMDSDNSDTVSTASSASCSSDEDDGGDENEDGQGTGATSVVDSADELMSISSTGATKGSSGRYDTRSRTQKRVLEGATPARIHCSPELGEPGKRDEGRRSQPTVSTAEPGTRFVVRVSP